MRRFTLLAVVILTPLVLARPAGSEPGILFILDGSGSMWGKIEGQPKIEIAKNTMIGLVRELPDELSAGLEVYGHRSAGDCDDIELLSSPANSDRDALIRQIQSITPRGKTPITDSFRLAAEQLKNSGGEMTLVLISDGKENCAGDPCAFLNELKSAGTELRVHVIGLAIDRAEREQLLCIATAGNGRYFDALNASQLAEALAEIRQAVLEIAGSGPRPQVSPKPVISITGSEVSTTGTLEIRHHESGDVYIFDQELDREQGFYCEGCPNNIPLPVGHYKLEFPSFVAEGVEIRSGERTLFDLNHITGTLEIKNHYGGDVHILDLSPAATLDDDVYVLDQQTGERRATYCERCGGRMRLPGGRYRLEFPEFVVEGVEIRPGENTVLDITSLELNQLRLQ